MKIILVFCSIIFASAALAAIPLKNGRYEIVAHVSSCPVKKNNTTKTQRPLCALLYKGKNSQRTFKLAHSPWHKSLASAKGILLDLKGKIDSGTLTLESAPKIHKIEINEIFDDRNYIKKLNN